MEPPRASRIAAAIEMITSGAVTPADIETIIAREPDKFDFDQVFVDEERNFVYLHTKTPERLAAAQEKLLRLARGEVDRIRQAQGNLPR